MSKKIEDVAIVIQARLGSQRIPRKMIKPFAGTTLIDIFLDKVKRCKSFPLSNFYLSAYEQEIKDTRINENHILMWQFIMPLIHFCHRCAF